MNRHRSRHHCQPQPDDPKPILTSPQEGIILARFAERALKASREAATAGTFVVL
ncbi:MAG TPA: hypothetical protein VLL25_13270 [Acidimicrobiales bacterium]|nr:hypothetical protein [Acidimicrobiales bacterium]